MNKIIIFSLVSTLPLTISLNQTQIILKCNKLIKGNWLESNKFSILKASKCYQTTNLNKIYRNNQIEINLMKNEDNQTIAEINAKKVQKKYYLSLENDAFHDNQTVVNFIKNKFYNDKVTRNFMSSNQYYALFDTKEDYQGKITKNETLNFRSSWGVWNDDQKESALQFNLHEAILKNFILINQNNKWGQLSRNNIEIVSITPKTLGILPLARIITTPIQEAIWTLKSISFNSKTYEKEYFHESQRMILPEGHANGQEWWNGLVSTLVVVTAILGVIFTFGGVAATLKGATEAFKTLIEIGSILVAGASLAFSINDLYINSSKKMLEDLKSDKYILDKIKDKIRENDVNLKVDQIMFENLRQPFLSTNIKGQTYAWAKATSIWGRESNMEIDNYWGALTADINYNIYE